ncbi:MAG: aspartate/glutamate racemase family protein [Methylocystis sp.]|nr:aspartate/glutamate racemase family protein [Methylocystis sp.]MCA3585406.1 aspartate/glutamate racemase family protein [Methylocystis sp.]MCA3587767.1 aspartate/glutamate racemase family protein [Methylocystis sp.]MCA3593369.1 aspartate/glutamate racemase family protein [Methylocystis sp.]
MNILVVKPNMTESITDRLVHVGSKVASAGATLIPATAPRGFPYISSRAEAQVAGAILLDMLAERQGSFDAAIIAAFGDPGFFAARELFDFPVIGMSEAAMLTACMLGKRSGIVTFAANLEPWYRECVEMHGLNNRLAGIRCAGGGFSKIDNVAEEKEAALIALAQQSIEDDGADVIILAGAPLSGAAEKIKDRIAVPLVDQMSAAIRQAETLQAETLQAETLVLLATAAARAGAFRRPPPKESSGLSSSLSARFSGLD